MLAQFFNSEFNNFKPVIPQTPISNPLYKSTPILYNQPIKRQPITPRYNYNNQKINFENNDFEIMKKMIENIDKELKNLETRTSILQEQKILLQTIINRPKINTVSEKPLINESTNDNIQYNNDNVQKKQDDNQNDIKQIYEDQNTEELNKPINPIKVDKQDKQEDKQEDKEIKINEQGDKKEQGINENIENIKQEDQEDNKNIDVIKDLKNSLSQNVDINKLKDNFNNSLDIQDKTVKLSEIIDNITEDKLINILSNMANDTKINYQDVINKI